MYNKGVEVTMISLDDLIKLKNETLNKLSNFPQDDVFGLVIDKCSKGIQAYHLASGEIYSWGFDEVEIVER